MDLLFIEGVAAVVAAVTVFIGSIFLLLAVIMGPRLAYFVSASITLAFVFIMTLVWSYGTPLGPSGQLPEWNPVALAETAGEIEFGPAAQYPEGPWKAPAEEDAAAKTRAAELESAAIDYLADAIQEKEGGEFLAETDASVVTESARLLSQGEDQYGALELEPSQAAKDKAAEADPDQSVTPDDATLIVVMKYDPGNPSGKARMLAGGVFLIFALHLFGLSRAERRSTKELNGGGAA
jgi:hypothetical protein